MLMYSSDDKEIDWVLGLSFKSKSLLQEANRAAAMNEK